VFKKTIVPLMCITLLIISATRATAVDAVRIPSGDLRITDGDIRLPTQGKGIVFSDSSVMNKLSDAQGIPGPQGEKGDPGPQGPQGIPGSGGALSGTRIVQQTAASNNGSVYTQVNCPDGMVVTGGGVTKNTYFSGNTILTDSWPCSLTSWCASGANMGGGPIQPYDLTTYAVCATGTPGAPATPNINATVLRFPGNAAPFGWLQQVDVYLDDQQSVPVTNATVTVNGNPIAYNPDNQSYEGLLDIPLGGSVTIAVTVGGVTYTVSGTQVTALPTPSLSSTWQANAANAITWTDGAPLSGTAYLVGVMGASGFVYPAGDTGPLILPISPANHTVPANSVAAGSYQVLVGIGTEISIANAATGSNLFIAGFATPVSITV